MAKKTNEQMIDHLNNLSIEQSKVKEETNTLEFVIKLNEQLTSENSKLLEQLDLVNDRINQVEANYTSAVNRLMAVRKERDGLIEAVNTRNLNDSNNNLEIQLIKSKWWYKLFSWL